MGDRVEALRHCRVLEGFTDVGLKILAQVVRERVYPTGQWLQVQGEPPRDQGSLVVLVSGRVRCEVKDSEGKTLELGVLEGGEHLGAMRLLGSESVSPVSAVADGDVQALVLNKAGFERLLRHKPQTAMKLMQLLAADFSARLGENAQSFADFAHFAAARANRSERTFTTYTDLQAPGGELTPGYKPHR